MVPCVRAARLATLKPAKKVPGLPRKWEKITTLPCPGRQSVDEPQRHRQKIPEAKFAGAENSSANRCDSRPWS